MAAANRKVLPISREPTLPAFCICYNTRAAGMAELVDAQVLGTCTLKVWRFKSSSRHQQGYITLKGVCFLKIMQLIFRTHA